MKLTAVVTGGAGFVGSHLCEQLAAKGYTVISLDDYSTGSEANHLAGIEYRRGHTKDITTLIPETPNLVFHLGEYARVEQSFNDIERVVDSNVVGTVAVLEFVRQKKCKLIYAGSSTKFTEEGTSLSPYVWTKASNTELVIRYGEWFSIPYAITYFYNVYGPRERSDIETGTLIAIFAEKWRKGETLTVRSPGTQKRNFTHVSDIVAGLLLVGELGEGDGYGLGHPDDYSVLEVAEMFGAQIEMLPERPGNRLSSNLSTEKAKALGWQAVQSLPKYINQMKNSGL